MYCRAHGKEKRCAVEECVRVAAPGKDFCTVHGEKPTCEADGCVRPRTAPPRGCEFDPWRGRITPPAHLSPPLCCT